MCVYAVQTGPDRPHRLDSFLQRFALGSDIAADFDQIAYKHVEISRRSICAGIVGSKKLQKKVDG